VGSAVLVVGERIPTRTNRGELKRKLSSQLPTMPSLGEAFKPTSDSGQFGGNFRMGEYVDMLL